MLLQSVWRDPGSASEPPVLMKLNTNAPKLKHEKYSITGFCHASLEGGSVMFLKFRFVGNAIPALALAFGFSLFAMNTPAWASDIKNLERKIEYLKQKKVLDD